MLDNLLLEHLGLIKGLGTWARDQEGVLGFPGLRVEVLIIPRLPCLLYLHIAVPTGRPFVLLPTW